MSLGRKSVVGALGERNRLTSLRREKDTGVICGAPRKMGTRQLYLYILVIFICVSVCLEPEKKKTSVKKVRDS